MSGTIRIKNVDLTKAIFILRIWRYCPISGGANPKLWNYPGNVAGRTTMLDYPKNEIFWGSGEMPIIPAWPAGAIEPILPHLPDDALAFSVIVRIDADSSEGQVRIDRALCPMRYVLRGDDRDARYSPGLTDGPVSWMGVTKLAYEIRLQKGAVIYPSPGDELVRVAADGSFVTEKVPPLDLAEV